LSFSTCKACRTGDRSNALVVPNDPNCPEEELRLTLTKHVQDCLTPPDQPRSFRFGPALPQSPNGKTTDWLTV
jgi:acyl-coenzyme A synthetase/AMP-(fatty) acid ligase